MKERFQKGYFARSAAGHDEGTVYVVLDVAQDYVYLADGRLKKADSPKKKKLKHVRPIMVKASGVYDRLNAGACVTDEEIKRSLKIYQTAHLENQKSEI